LIVARSNDLRHFLPIRFLIVALARPRLAVLPTIRSLIVARSRHFGRLRTIRFLIVGNPWLGDRPQAAPPSRP